jgi:GAF domain-containing protein
MAESRFHPERVISAFGKVAAAIAAGGRRNDVLQLIAASVRDLVDADLAGVTVRLANDDLLTVAADGLGSERHLGRRFPHEGSRSDIVLRAGKTLVVEDLSANSEVAARVPDLPLLGPTVFAPVLIDTPNGVLTVSRVTGRALFTPEEVELIGSFASQAALVLRRECERQRAATLERVADQTRIAAELQDTAISEIFAASLTMSRLAGSADPAEAELAVHAIASLDNAIKLIRQAIFGMKESHGGRNEDE